MNTEELRGFICAVSVTLPCIFLPLNFLQDVAGQALMMKLQGLLKESLMPTAEDVRSYVNGVEGI